MNNAPDLKSNPLANAPNLQSNLPPVGGNVELRIDAAKLGEAAERFGTELTRVAQVLAEKLPNATADEVNKILAQIQVSVSAVLTGVQTIIEAKPNMPVFPALPAWPSWPPWPEWPPLPQPPVPQTPPPLDAVEILKQIGLGVTAAEGILNDNGLAIISGNVETELSVKLPGQDGSGAFTKINFQINPKPIQ